MKDLRWIWLLTAAATVGFICQQSTLPPAESAEVSASVRDVIVSWLGGADTRLGAFFDRFVRKIAHFVEFATLGAQIEAYLAGRQTRIAILCLAGFGLAVASLDETLQLFTGRGAALTDVLLDFSGYLFGALAIFAICLLWRAIMKKGKGDAV